MSEKNDAPLPVVMDLLTPPLAQAALEFLSRANLIGKEVSVFTEVANALAELAGGKVVVVAATLPEDFAELRKKVGALEHSSASLIKQLSAAADCEAELLRRITLSKAQLEAGVRTGQPPLPPGKKVSLRQRAKNALQYLSNEPVTSTANK